MVTRKKAVDNPKKKGGSKNDSKNNGGGGGLSSSSSFPFSLAAVTSPLFVFVIVVLAIGLERVHNEIARFLVGGSGFSGRGHGSPLLPEVHVAQSVVDQQKWDPPNPQIQDFLNRACLPKKQQKAKQDKKEKEQQQQQQQQQQYALAYCHDALRPEGRVFRATRQISIGEPLLKIPRSLQIWDLDALRDSFVRRELIRARHKMTGNHLGSGAFLAAYIALQLEQHWLRHDCDDDKASCDEFIKPLDPLRLAFLETLPNVNELSYHPILWKVELLDELLGHPSVAKSVVYTYRNMVGSEYEAFSQISRRFARLVTKDSYTAARLNVLSRAFRTGRPGPEEEQPQENGGRSLEEELRGYREILHMDLEGGEGCLAMIPIADLLNHHPSFNAIERYKHADPHSNDEEEHQGSFVVKVHGRRMDTGSEPFISYGEMSDAHLFGRYGFVVGDGSGSTQIHLAFHHDVLNLSISDQYNYLPYSGMTQKLYSLQRAPLLRYLQFDDGYVQCIPGPSSHPEEAELKRLKFLNLQKIANHRHRWVLDCPARNPRALPGERLLKPPHYKRTQIIEEFDVSAFQETCRFVAMINTDYDGTAMDMLQDNLETGDFFSPEGNGSLEFRTLLCIARWIGTSLLMLGDVTTMGEMVRRSNVRAYGSRNWTAHHVRLGEMQALQAIQTLVLTKIEEKWPHKKYEQTEDFTLRDNACPDEYMAYLEESQTPTFEE